MAYTKYSLTPANNTAAPPDGAPEGMLPSAVNDTMRDMMAQIRDCGDGIRDGTYTMTAPKITGGTITGATFTGNTFSNPIVTGVSTFAAGTVSAPAITTTGDTNTGIFFPAADTIAFTEGGVESMRIDSSGNLGVGTSSPSTKLELNTASSYGGLRIKGTSSVSNGFEMALSSDGVTGNFWLYENSAMRFATNSTERMRIDSSGNVGILNSAPATALETGTFGTGLAVGSTSATHNITIVSSTSSTLSALKFGDGGSGVYDQGYLIYDHANNAMLMGTNRAERMRITSGGDVLVGTTNSSDSAGVGCKIINLSTVAPSVALVGSASTNGTGTGFEMYSTGASAYRFYVGYGGTIFATSTTITAISDQRLKENIQDIDVGLDKVMALKPRKFDWKAGKGKDKKGDRGWIAQEFEQVFPEMIDTWKDPAPEGEEPYKSVNADLIPVLVKAIQEQQAIITDLKARIETLENK